MKNKRIVITGGQGQVKVNYWSRYAQKVFRLQRMLDGK
jgi:hypothetical protein